MGLGSGARKCGNVGSGVNMGIGSGCRSVVFRDGMDGVLSVEMGGWVHDGWRERTWEKVGLQKRCLSDAVIVRVMF